MKIGVVAVISLGLAAGVAGAQSPSSEAGPDAGARQGRQGGFREGRGIWGMGQGTVGTVTEVTADHFTIKTELGETYTIHYSVNTRVMKQPPRPERRGQRGGGPGQSEGEDQGEGQGQGQGQFERTPPTPIKASEIKVGDVIAAGGEVDEKARSVGAVFVLLMDPERAKEMRAMEANFGKTWLMGRVKSIHEVTVTLEGGPKNETHTFTADENTTFRKRREPITLADIQVGDVVRVEGAVKNGTFLAATVADMGVPREREGEGGPGAGPPAMGPQ